MLLLLATGIGLSASALMVPYRDVAQVLPVAVTLLLYISPVGYSLSSVPASAQIWFELNPLTGLLEGFRWAILGVGTLDAFATVWAVVCSIALFFVGALVFTRMERRFADVV